ncbi:hypothetical protein PR202_ga27696 [Eleusine coracana subsp. coracana]|uniref:Uncharacterized protein n=1 Tax=Eleusine coracana subsp. coracana TaxID=191504 RepID=A0AAV5DHI5_ELECO|nr:hypothetical protein PR202_ga27696 [Eleusine coracana subsp. coracana]
MADRPPPFFSPPLPTFYAAAAVAAAPAGPRVIVRPPRPLSRSPRARICPLPAPRGQIWLAVAWIRPPPPWAPSSCRRPPPRRRSSWLGFGRRRCGPSRAAA